MKIRFILRSNVIKECEFPFRPSVGDYVFVHDERVGYQENFIVNEVIFNTMTNTLDVILN
jgi:hypothetical protein